MIVKANEKQISFLYQETDIFFEMGCDILEQVHIKQMLPYKRKQQNGREKLIFKISEGNVIKLADSIENFSEHELIRLLYEIFLLNVKIEENGFLKRECIWYQYEHIYFDTEQQSVMVAILPITGELRYADGVSWHGHFEETVAHIVNYLPQQKADQIKKLVSMLEAHFITDENVLEELRELDCGMPEGRLTVRDVMLQLLYSGQNGRVVFEVGSSDFLIGRNAEAADGVISEELSRAVSRKHCLITRMQNKYFVQDLESVNHTLVNGIMIPPYELMELEHNDILSIADLEFRVIKVEKNGLYLGGTNER